jgi:hypothetical protein
MDIRQIDRIAAGKRLKSIPFIVGGRGSGLSIGARVPCVIVKSFRGPVAQLGARFHGMEEVDGSNPSRSTKFLKDLAALLAFVAVTGVHLESKFGRRGVKE